MSDIIVRVQGLSYTYMAGTPLAAMGLQDATLTLRQGEFAALIGAGGSGKSTLVSFLNGLLRPRQEGQVVVFGQDTASPTCDIISLRRYVGLVFQYPHHQFLEQHVGDDIAHGPRQLGLSREEIRERVRWAMEAVGLDFQDFVDRRTFSLSGGEMRRVALAGVLAMKPDLLVLDEATTGLDPRGRAQIHEVLHRLRADRGMTILLVSNDMDEVAELADRVTVLHEGKTVLAGPTREILGKETGLEGYGLAPPITTRVLHALRQADVPIAGTPLTRAEVEEAIWQAMRP
ncbi:MAG: ATP-binding cassette domain-containing protein [Chloroflexota bacterium]|nr:ATP-binding cassette domain-containing protein [Chloroflexota bacterium]